MEMLDSKLRQNNTNTYTDIVRKTKVSLDW